MKALRIVAVLLSAVFLSATAFGFVAHRSLEDSVGFADSMAAALQEPQVNSELQESVRTSVTDTVEELADDEGLIGSLLAGVGADSIADAAARAVDSPAFEEAWDDWALLLHQGLADFAVGQPNSEISVTGQYIEVKIGPLVTPLLGGGLAATLSGPVDTLLGDRSVVVDTGVDMESRLKALGAFAGARWFLAVGAALALAIVVLIGPQRIRWLSISLAAAGLGLATLALTLTFGDSSIASSTTPALNESILSALRSDWTGSIGIWAVVLIAAAVGLALISRSESPDDAEDQNPI